MAEEETKPVVHDAKTNELVVVDEGPKRFVAQGPLVVQDTKTGMYWLKKDSWLDRQKYLNWHESIEFAERKNVRKTGGFSDWRLPTNEEAATLYDEAWKNTSKTGEALYIDSLYSEGSFKMQWTMADTSTRRPRFDYTQGQIASADEYAFGAVRICRKDPVKTVGRRRNT